MAKTSKAAMARQLIELGAHKGFSFNTLRKLDAMRLSLMLAAVETQTLEAKGEGEGKADVSGGYTSPDVSECSPPMSSSPPPAAASEAVPVAIMAPVSSEPACKPVRGSWRDYVGLALQPFVFVWGMLRL